MTISLEYLAGFFDGEGCVNISKNHQLTVTAAQNDTEVLEILKAHFGGSVTVVNRCGRWTLWGEAMKPMLLAILPFLIVKKAQVQVAIAFIDTHRATSPQSKK